MNAVDWWLAVAFGFSLGMVAFALLSEAVSAWARRGRL